MWTPRTPEEQGKWEQSALREARSHGRLLAGAVWGLVTFAAACGWRFFAPGSMVMATQRTPPHGFWRMAFVVGLGLLPLAYLLFRWESARELERQRVRTICAGCDLAGSANVGATCSCGKQYVLASTVKWVESKA